MKLKKRKLTLALAILLVFTALFSACNKKGSADGEASADSVPYTSKITATFTDYRYAAEDGGIVIIEYTGYSKEAYIPSEIEDKPVVKIGEEAFKNRDIEKVHIPYSVESISSSAFYNCTKLKEITIPDSVTYIGFNTFYNCAALENIILPNGITGIGNYVFSGCLALKSITIPDSIKSIGTTAFIHCAEDLTVTYKGIEYTAFYSEGNECYNISDDFFKAVNG